MTDDPFELPFGNEFDPDSPAAAMARLRDRFHLIHPQASLIITGYAALELEVDQIFRRLVARPEKLPRLSMDHQLGLLRAMLDDPWLDSALNAIGAFGAVRNSVAHGDPTEVIDRGILNLGKKSRAIGLPPESYPNLGLLAMHLASSLHVGTEFYECIVRDRQ